MSEGEGRTGNGGDVSKCRGSRAERYEEGLTVGHDCGAQERFGGVQGGGRVVRSSRCLTTTMRIEIALVPAVSRSDSTR